MARIAAPKLSIDKLNMSGEVVYPDSWAELDPFARMDILVCWIAEFQSAYAEARAQHYGESDSEAAKAETANEEMEDDELNFRIEEVRKHPLFDVLLLAVEQAMFGKGGRHGGNKTPFLKQPWVHYSNMHGRGFLTGQATKKLEEAASTREGEAFITEVLGAIVYSGMSIIKERGIK